MGHPVICEDEDIWTEILAARSFSAALRPFRLRILATVANVARRGWLHGWSLVNARFNSSSSMAKKIHRIRFFLLGLRSRLEWTCKTLGDLNARVHEQPQVLLNCLRRASLFEIECSFFLILSILHFAYEND